MEPAPNTEKLDEHLKEVVRALTGAVAWGVSHQKDSQLVEKAIQDCKEILDVVMEGKVDEWVN
jgi:hypothetical protein